jgi:hypothetical protein
MRFRGNGKKYMNLRSIGKLLTATAVIASMCNLVEAQSRRRTQPRKSAQVRAVAPSNSASHVAAEIMEGKVSTVSSKPGDTFVVMLQNDVKGSDGQIVLTKGTAITGVIRNLKQIEASGAPKSMVEIEWLAPVVERKATPSLSIALQSLTQIDPTYRREQEKANELALPATNAKPLGSSKSIGPTNSLLPGRIASVVPSTTTAISPVASLASGRSNRALLSMPSVVAVDQETSVVIDGKTGSASSSPLFKIGSGHIVTADGALLSVDMFSHLNNDTVITSTSQDFEISTGTQIQMLVGVTRK